MPPSRPDDEGLVVLVVVVVVDDEVVVEPAVVLPVPVATAVVPEPVEPVPVVPDVVPDVEDAGGVAGIVPEGCVVGVDDVGPVPELVVPWPRRPPRRPDSRSST